jgi:L-alanine-DL-glutamate epimerase-like enolase superfamily enzyme
MDGMVPVAEAVDAQLEPLIGDGCGYRSFVPRDWSRPKADRIEPVFGGLFEDEPLPRDGHVILSDAPGWGLELDRSRIKPRRPYRD